MYSEWGEKEEESEWWGETGAVSVSEVPREKVSVQGRDSESRRSHGESGHLEFS